MSVDKIINVSLGKPSLGEVNLCKPGIQAVSIKEIIGSQNYEMLFNKPSINGVTLFGNKTADDLDLSYAPKIGTTEYWDAQISYVPRSGEIIVYSDYYTEDGQPVPAIKIGDGNAFVVDLPFLTDNTRSLLEDHIRNTVVHITQAERDSWNNKVTCDVVEINDEYNLVFTKD